MIGAGGSYQVFSFGFFQCQSQKGAVHAVAQVVPIGSACSPESDADIGQRQPYWIDYQYYTFFPLASQRSVVIKSEKAIRLHCSGSYAIRSMYRSKSETREGNNSAGLFVWSIPIGVQPFTSFINNSLISCAASNCTQCVASGKNTSLPSSQ